MHRINHPLGPFQLDFLGLEGFQRGTLIGKSLIRTGILIDSRRCLISFKLRTGISNSAHLFTRLLFGGKFFVPCDRRVSFASCVRGRAKKVGKSSEKEIRSRTMQFSHRYVTGRKSNSTEAARNYFLQNKRRFLEENVVKFCYRNDFFRRHATV